MQIAIQNRRACTWKAAMVYFQANVTKLRGGLFPRTGDNSKHNWMLQFDHLYANFLKTTEVNCTFFKHLY